jgi:hypothetical protein
MPTVKTLQLLNLLGFAFMITMNVLANALPLFGRNTGEISAFYPNLFVPAGFTFSIWGVIYLLLLVFTAAQLRGAFGGQRPAPDYVAAIGPWFFLSCLANGLWIIVWHALLPLLSLVVMLALLACLILINQAFYGQHGARPAEGWQIARLPFSVYLGWISVATIANATAVLIHYGWGGFGLGPELWTVIMIAVASAAGLIFLWRQSNIPYALVIIWALYGIFARTDAEAHGGIYWALIIGIGLLAAGSGVRLVKK